MTELTPDFESLLGCWHVGSVRLVDRIQSGVNNESWRVDTVRGDFVLRIHKNAGARKYIPFEHKLLTELAQASQLSFAVPAPLPTEEGGTVVDFCGYPTSLARLIPGRHPERGNPPEVRLAGGALAELHSAMAAVRIEANDPSLTAYGDLRRVHPAITDPAELGEMLGLEGEILARYTQRVEQSESTYPALQQILPTQIIHSDYVISNVLIDSDRMTGVLDFEFAAPDLRAMDFAIGLSRYGILGHLGEEDSMWRLVEAFAGGYFERIQLSSQEIEAFPALLGRYNVVGILHWAGRWRVGLSTEGRVRERIEQTMQVEDWLQEQGDRLVSQLAARC